MCLDLVNGDDHGREKASERSLEDILRLRVPMEQPTVQSFTGSWDIELTDRQT